MNLIKTIVIFASLLASASAQVLYGVSSTPTTAAFTLTVNGTGTGSVTSADAYIAACTSAGGANCSHTYVLGASVTLTATPTAGSTFSWSGGSPAAPGPGVCSGIGLTCTFTVPSTATLNAVFTAAGGTAIQASPLFSIDLNSSAQYPTTINHGQDRFWDTPSIGWSYMTACTGGGYTCAANAVTYTWTSFDSVLATAFTSAVHNAQMALSRTPSFASSDLTLCDGLNGYPTGDYCTQSGSGKVTMSGTNATIVAGPVTGATPTGGTGYSAGQLLTIVGGGGTGGKLSIAAVSGGVPTAYTVSSAGRDYVPGSVTLTGGGGTGATATLGVNLNCVTSWNGLAVVISGALYTVGTCTNATPNFTITSGAPATGDFTVIAQPGLPGHSPGQNAPPTDLATNGTGTDLYFRYWIKNLVTHASDATYLLTHARIVDYEVLNEPDTSKFFNGTYDQQVRLEEDAYQLIKGDKNNFVLTSVNGTGIYQGTITNGASNYYVGSHFTITGFGNGSNNLTNAVATASTATSITFAATTVICASACGTTRALQVNSYTGEKASDVWATVGIGAALDPTAAVLMGSYHGGSASTIQAKCFLYNVGSCNTGTQSRIASNDGAIWTDHINFHLKPGDSSPTLEGQMDAWITGGSGINSFLLTPDLAKPLDNTEGGYSAAGWGSPAIDIGLQAAFIGRYYPYALCDGIANNVWYDWSAPPTQLGSTLANQAYSQIYNWLVGATLGTCSTSAPGTANAGHFTYTVTLTLNTPGGPVAAAIIWDNSQTCTSGGTSCSTTTQTVGGSYLSYIPLLGPVSSCTIGQTGCTTISSHTVPVGIQPILVQAQ